MKIEYKYFGTIFFIFLLSIASLTALFKKYALLTFQHLVDTCQQLVATFFSSGTHFIGLMLVALAVVVAVIFFAKTIFSLLKTQKKIDLLLAYKSNTVPNKLRRVLKKVGLKKDEVVVVQKRSNHAFNYGVRSQKILLSKGLIKNLTLKQLEAVVLHEQYHLENQHSPLLILSEVISSTLFFLPIAKEVNKKMKVMFEKQADAFAENIQGSSSYLNMALLKVPNSRIQYYPGFAMRREHEMSRNSVFVSIFVILVAVSLFLFPTNLHANKEIYQERADECAQSQCTTHCPTDKISKELLMSSNLQHSLSFISH